MKNHLPTVSYETFAEQFNRPPSKVSMIYGNELAFGLSLWMAAHAASLGKMIAVVDGCNRFNVHSISKFARQHKVDPDLLLRRIFLSRGFTCYQMESVITDRLPRFLKQTGGSTALILGLLDPLYDEQAPFREVVQILRRVIAALQNMRRQGTSLLLVSQEWNIHPSERNRLFRSLKSSMDQVYRFEVTIEHRPLLFVEHQERYLDGQNRRNIYESD
jgi:hypothetical protein